MDIIRTYRYSLTSKRTEPLPAYWYELTTKERRSDYIHYIYRDPIVKMVCDFGNGKVPEGADIYLDIKTLIKRDCDMRDSKEPIYVLYKGDGILAMGTVDEIAEKMGIPRKTVLHYGSKSWKSRKNIDWDTARVLVKAEDDDES